VLIEGFEAGPWGTNCYILAPAPNSECIIVDPGKDSLDQINAVIARHHLHPVAALLTHGHIDHTWSVVPLCDSHAIPGVIHSADRHLLKDPIAGLSRETAGVIGMMAGSLPMSEPRDVVVVRDGDALDLAGQRYSVRHAPGHTQGSVAFMTRDDTRDVDLMLSGDLLFKGAIGRTDLPGGDWGQMLDSLSRVVLTLPDDTVVLPGHGPSTTIGLERVENMYLRQAAAEPPHRGL
jgi:hydroxyacylglutathione hydrolase